MEKMVDLSFYKGKKVLLTGHTGFKGSWMTRILLNAGAEVTGFSLPAPTDPSLFDIADVEPHINSITGDVRELDKLMDAFRQSGAEIVFHMAAQPIVRESYSAPVYTYETNVMGTVNFLECVRLTSGIKSVINITTDKVYLNREWNWGYRENEELCGFDPYSNSKSCSELVTYSYVNSFFNSDASPAVSTARSGNVIGGGDFAADRIIPDCVRAAMSGGRMTVRNAHSTRPYQHVLECLSGYLLLAQAQYENRGLMGNYNFGPDDSSCVDTARLVDLFCSKWGEGFGWDNKSDNGPHEANFLKLDCSKSKAILNWHPHWSIETAVESVVDFTKIYRDGGSIPQIMDKQIASYFSK